MQRKTRNMLLSRILCMMLIVAMAFTTVGCGTKDNGGNNQPSTETQGSTENEKNVLGEGQTKFAFVVVDKVGNETSFEIHTDKETVGEALLDVKLIEGEDGVICVKGAVPGCKGSDLIIKAVK